MNDMPISNYRYRLEVSQEPIRARMCGFGDKDRRPIDPPPIVRLFISLPDGIPASESSIDYSMMIVHVTLSSEDRKEERSLVINPSAIPGQSTGPTSSIMSFNPPISIRTLVGHCTSPAYQLRDHTGQRGIYFIFQDLSVRTEGIYTLKFSLCDIKGLLSPDRVYDEFSMVRGSVLAEVYSAPFRVYSAKKFPGMTESTALSKAFASQGIKITIRKDFRYQKTSNDELQDDELLNQTNVTPDNHKDNSDEPSDTDSLQEIIKKEQ